MIHTSSSRYPNMYMCYAPPYFHTIPTMIAKMEPLRNVLSNSVLIMYAIIISWWEYNGQPLVLGSAETAKLLRKALRGYYALEGGGGVLHTETIGLAVEDRQACGDDQNSTPETPCTTKTGSSCNVETLGSSYDGNLSPATSNMQADTDQSQPEIGGDSEDCMSCVSDENSCDKDTGLGACGDLTDPCITEFSGSRDGLFSRVYTDDQVIGGESNSSGGVSQSAYWSLSLVHEKHGWDA
jgi:hypothetical protein